MADKPPALPGPPQETTRLPAEPGRRRPGQFQHVQTKPPERGMSTDQALAEMQRRRAEGAGATGGATAPRGRQRQRGEVYTAPDGSRIPVPPAPPAASTITEPLASLIQSPGPQPTLGPQPTPGPQPTLGPQPAPGPQPTEDAASASPASFAGDASPTVPVTIDGQVVNLSLGELVGGYLRGRDYTAKTQASAAQLRQALDAQTQFNAARERLERRLTEIVGLDADEFAKPVDWVTLAKTDPIGYSQKHARYLARGEMLAEQQRLAELRQREEAGRKQYALQTGHQTLCQIIPGWSDPAMRGQLQARLLSHLKLRGFTDEEIARREMIDPREVVMLLESALWAQHAGQGAPAPQPVGTRTLAGAGTGVSPGAGFRDGMAPDVRGLDDRFSATRKIDDAVALLQARRRAAAAPEAAPPRPLRPNGR